MPDASRTNMDRLEQALAVYVQWIAEGEPADSARLLSDHVEYADLLEAMLADRDEIEAGVSATEIEGQVLGDDFRIIAEIGRGGMGVVYRARQLSLDREVALKVLPAHVTLHPTAIARFRREASTAARIEHPGIVAVHAVGRDGDTHFFAMELIDGVPLSRDDPRTGEPRSVRDCVELCAAVLDALDHAHRRGVLHRDVKPSNILLRVDGRPVLTDFGLARDLTEPGWTRSGDFAGTPHYVSPEQAAGRTDLDGRSDVFSLGTTLYELLTGRRPFDGDTVAAVLTRIATADPVDPLRLTPELSEDLAAIVLKALERDPGRRYATAAAFARDLRAFLEFRPIEARRSSLSMRARRWIRREPLRAALAAVLAVGVPALSAALGYLVANRDVLVVGAQQVERQRRDERLAQVTIDYEAGDFAQALAIADRSVTADPHDVEARALRAIVQLALGLGAEALAGLDERTADLDRASVDRARVYLLSAIGREADARELEDRLGVPTRPDELFLAGCVASHRARSTRGDRAAWDAVRETFARAMRVSPAPRLHYAIRWTDATLMIGDRDAVGDCVRTLRTLWPDTAGALLYTAFALRQSDPVQAIADYRRVLAAGYRHPRIHSTIADCLDRLGDSAGAAAERTRAIDGYRQREAAGSSTPDDRVNLAVVLSDGGQRDAAIAAARRAVDVHPKMPRARVFLGWLLETAADLDGAAAMFSAAADLSPLDPEPLRRLGTNRMRADDPAGATRAFERWTRLQPNAAMAWHMLGNALSGAGDTAAAIDANRRAVELDPGPPEFHFNLGLALSKAGQLEAAARACADAVARRGDYARAHALLAEVWDALGDADAALAALDRAVEVTTDPGQREELQSRRAAMAAKR